MASKTQGKSNRRVGPKEREAREQRAANAAKNDPTVDADPAKAAAAIETKPKPKASAPTIDAQALASDLIEQVKTAVGGVKPVSKKTCTAIQLDKKTLAYVVTGTKFVGVDFSEGKGSTRHLERVKLVKSSEIPKVVKRIEKRAAAIAKLKNEGRETVQV